LTSSLVLSAVFNSLADKIYNRYKEKLAGLERSERLPGDEDINLLGHRILVFGMGRVGRSAYDEIRAHAEEKIVGIDIDEDRVEQNCSDGRNVVLGDATNPEFWSRLIASHQEIEMVLLAMPVHNANLDAAKKIRERGYQGPIVATAHFPDHEEELRNNGIDEVFNIYAEAGAGAAMHVHNLLTGNDSR